MKYQIGMIRAAKTDRPLTYDANSIPVTEEPISGLMEKRTESIRIRVTELRVLAQSFDIDFEYMEDFSANGSSPGPWVRITLRTDTMFSSWTRDNPLVFLNLLPHVEHVIWREADYMTTPWTE